MQDSTYSLPYSVYQDLVDERDLQAIARDAIANTEGGEG